MSNQNIVVKSNDLIEARYKLSLNEQRLVIFLISIIQPEDDDFRDYELRISEFALTFGIDNVKSIHALLKDAARSLMVKLIDLSVGNEWNYVTWFSNARYVEKKGVIVIRFDKALKKYLLQLKGQFTQYNLQYIVKFKSSYAIRLYELLKSYQYLGDGGGFYREFSLLDLKIFFGIENGEYEVFFNFKNRVIVPSVKEINQHSDIFISSVEYIKDGRAVSKIRFMVEPKLNLIALPSKEIGVLSDAVLALRHFGIAEPTIQKWVKDYGNESILNACRFVHAKQVAGEVKEAPAYLAKSLKEGYYVAWLEEQRKKEEKRAFALAQKAEKDELERRERDAIRQRVDAVLDEFHFRPEVEQANLRVVYGKNINSILAKSWKRCMSSEAQPENDVRFRFDFANFLQGYDASLAAGALPAVDVAVSLP
jgi:hypothetical protein